MHLGRSRRAVRAAQPAVAEPGTICGEVYRALVLGLRDYVLKNGFSSGADRPVRRHRLRAGRRDRRRRARAPTNVFGVSNPSE